MPNPSDFDAVFARLRAILHAFEPFLAVQTDTPDHYYLNLPCTPKDGRSNFFAAVKIKKNYVSYHLFPVYVYPALLDTLTPRLKKRMQGKACFNFTTVDEDLFGDLTQLTEQGLQTFREHERL